MTLGYKGRKYRHMDGYTWKVVAETMLDGKTYVKLRRVWRPFSQQFRYAVARGGGLISWVNEGADLLAASIERGRRR